MGILPNNTDRASTKKVGDAAEDEALLYLQQQGLRLQPINVQCSRMGKRLGNVIHRVVQMLGIQSASSKAASCCAAS